MEKRDDALLRVENLRQYFKIARGEYNKAVDGVSFEIKKGEVFGLVGESGCGKTTTGRSIIGLYDITDGEVYFKGVRIAAGTLGYKSKIDEAKREYAKRIRAAATADEAGRLKAELRSVLLTLKESIAEARRTRKKAARAGLITEIQMIFQDPVASLDPRMTVREIISEGLIIRGERDRESINTKVSEMLRLVGLLPEYADRYPHEFSGGQRQRIGIARSVIMNPEMIIADEPVSALDVSVQAQVINLLNELRDKLGLTILFVAHDLSVVKYFSDRIAVMYLGKIVELANSDELFSNPLHPYTRSLLSAIPLPDPVYEKSRVRTRYSYLEDHDYSVDKPSMREVSSGHFVYCNGSEFEKYMREMNGAADGNGGREKK